MCNLDLRDMIRRMVATQLLVLASVLFVAAQPDLDYREPRPLNTASSIYPDEARMTGLGGKISVRVTIDKEGKVTSADQAVGPDWTCPSIKRPDVIALRNAARDAALRSTFSPATKNSKPVKVTLWMNFVYPNRLLSEKIDKERALQEAKENGLPPPDEPEIVARGVLNGRAKHLAAPEYTKAAVAAGESGSVYVEIVIDTDGTVFSAHPISMLTYLPVAARDAACRSKFSPTLVSGKPVIVSGTINYNFGR